MNQGNKLAHSFL